jgi:hypothetical protein
MAQHDGALSARSMFWKEWRGSADSIVGVKKHGCKSLLGRGLRLSVEAQHAFLFCGFSHGIREGAKSGDPGTTSAQSN